MAEVKQAGKTVVLPEVITVRKLAELLGVSAIEVIKALISDGIMANINQTIDYDTAAIVAAEMGFEPRPEVPAAVVGAEPPTTASIPEFAPHREIYAEEAPENLVARPPVVTVMGHVDHGKTSLLDSLRLTRVAASEAGGITQHIGAYQIERQGRRITFLDTPGHEAFTAMRARGAQVTDVAVLVVAADDGVMPQTLEAIDHARAARVPLLVALSKIDKPSAQPERVKKQLAQAGLALEEHGGEVVCVSVSAKTGEGIEQLLEMILLVADLAELRANPNRLAVGTVVEGKLDKTRGPLATVLVQNGTLKLGDYLVVDGLFGRVRAMFNDAGKRVKGAPPSTPVMVLGLSEVPRAGTLFRAAPDERAAKALASEQAQRAAAAPRATARLSLDELYAQIQAGKVKELKVVLKADGQGSLEAVRNSLEKLGDEQVKVRLIHEGVGNVTESDVNLSIASQAVIIAFNVQAEPTARSMAEAEGIEMRTYQVIYKLIDDLAKALQGLLEPVYREVVIGRAVVRAIFQIAKRGKVAGAYVEEGSVIRNAEARLLRAGQELHRGQIVSLKRFLDDAKEVTQGLECGVALEGFQDFHAGDVLEVYKKERVS